MKIILKVLIKWPLIICLTILCFALSIGLAIPYFIFTSLFKYMKTLKWSVLIILSILCFVLAIVNNIRVDETKKVEWIGSQEVMPKPDEVL